ncbi:hypothetical protein [Streptomyces sp. NBC_00996]|uniref:hypothetical protein n=1 Tax=Streptomyces sp. NBC_00996 TaxID=2903710 RepID=UPI003870E6F8|nr:hypothetical protein OG390_49660 [Streptomyces sp. NBC_00996]
MFAWCNASVTDAHILAWAADQDWFAVTADEKETAQLAAVGASARSIVEANPDFAPGAAEDDEPPLAGDGKPVRAAAVAVVRRGTGAAHRAFGLLTLPDVHSGRPRHVPSAS